MSASESIVLTNGEMVKVIRVDRCGTLKHFSRVNDDVIVAIEDGPLRGPRCGNIYFFLQVGGIYRYAGHLTLRSRNGVLEWDPAPADSEDEFKSKVVNFHKKHWGGSLGDLEDIDAHALNGAPFISKPV